MTYLTQQRDGKLVVQDIHRNNLQYIKHLDQSALEPNFRRPDIEGVGQRVISEKEVLINVGEKKKFFSMTKQQPSS